MTTQSADHNGLFVMLLLDGRNYAYLYTPMSHGHPQEKLSEVGDINNATARPRSEWRSWMKYGTLVPVTVSRRVTIIPG